MTKPNTAKVGREAVDLRQRAARARDGAGRSIRHASPAEPEVQPALPTPVALPPGQVLADAIDLTDAPLSTLLAVHDVADMLSDLAAAVTCQPRCYVDGAYRREENAAGRLAGWINEACNWVADAAIAEARRREPGSSSEAIARLSIIGRSDVGGGDRAELSHLVTDLAALSASLVER